MDIINESLPKDLETEKAMVGCAVNRPELTFAECEGIEPSMLFYDRMNLKLWGYAKGLYTQGLPIGLESMYLRLHESGELSSVGGMPYLQEACSFTPGGVAHLILFRDSLVELWSRRECINLFDEAKLTARNFSYEDGDEWMAGVMGRLLDITNAKGGQRKRRTWKELLDRAFERAENSIKTMGALPGLATGYRITDAITGGLQRGQVWIVGGASSDGKSAYVQNVAKFLVECDHSVCLYSLEMSDDENADRFMSMQSRVPSGVIKRGMTVRSDLESFTKATGAMRNYPMHIRDVSGIKLSELIADMRMMKSAHGIKVFSVDYSQLVSPDRKAHTREREVAEVSAAFKATAKNLDCTIIAQSQLNDDGKLRESRALGFDADVVFTLSMPDNEAGEKDEKRRIGFIGKNRNGERNKPIMYDFDGPTFTFTEQMHQPDFAKKKDPPKQGREPYKS